MVKEHGLKGDKYVGEFRDGYRNGQGTFIWSDEGKYEGKWKDGKFHGQGTFTFSDGNKGVGVNSEIINLGTSQHMTKTETTNGSM